MNFLMMRDLEINPVNKKKLLKMINSKRVIKNERVLHR